MRNTCRILVGKPKRKSVWGRLGRKRNDNIKIDIK
jgi:hypothetical protein